MNRCISNSKNLVVAKKTHHQPCPHRNTDAGNKSFRGNFKKLALLHPHFSRGGEREGERENMANENRLSMFPRKQPCLTVLFCEFKRVSSGKFVFNIQAFKPCKLVGQWPFLFQCLLVPYLHTYYIRRAFEYNFTWIKGRTFASANQDIWLFL